MPTMSALTTAAGHKPSRRRPPTDGLRLPAMPAGEISVPGTLPTVIGVRGARHNTAEPARPGLPPGDGPMTLNAMPDDRPLGLAPLDEKVDHVRGSPTGRLIIEYGDYECPYSRQAFHAIEQVERQLG